MKKIVVIISFLLLINNYSFSKDPILQINVTPNKITIGSPFNYKMSLYYDKELNLIKVPQKETFTTKKSLNYLKETTKKSSTESRKYIEITYSLSMFDIGKHYIPTQSLTLQHAASKKYKKLILPAYPIYVSPVSNIEDPENLYVKISDALFFELKLNWIYIIFTLIGILCLIITIVLGLRFIKKKKITTQSTISPKEITRSAFEVFEDEITSNFKKINDSPTKDYYVKFSEIIKAYLSTILAINCIEQTSTEINILTKSRLNEQDYRRIKHLLAFIFEIYLIYGSLKHVINSIPVKSISSKFLKKFHSNATNLTSLEFK